MYELSFSLEKRPFVAAPLVDRYYPAASIEAARKTLLRTIERAEGPALVIGASGIGKTLLCRMVADHFRRAFRVALLASTHVGTRKALFQNILFELGLPYREMEEGELRLSLVDHLEPSDRCPNGMLLIVDEAHTLPLRLMEEIRMISNLMRDQQARVRLVLAGGPALEERFSSPKLESFNQRIAARCYLHSMTREETTAYVQTQFARVGGDANLIFGDDSYRAIFNATDGVPRLINQVCDHALLLASLGGKKHIDAAGVEEAWSDLQQLPAPWSDRDHPASSFAAASGVVEFGELSDEGEHSPISSAERHLEVVESGLGYFASETLPKERRQRVEAIESETVDEPTFVHSTVADSPPNPRHIRPEIELYFHAPHDPFGDVFEEEEVVIDRYASLEDDVGRGAGGAGGISGKGRIRVSSAESSEIASALTSSPALSGTRSPQIEFGTQVEPAAEETPAELVVSREFEEPLAFAAVGLPTYDSPPPAAPPVVNRRDSQAGDEADDRDLIRIEDHDLSALPPGRGRVRRQEYRQLFARLRSSQS